MATAPRLKDLMGAKLKVTGADLPAGSYPAILYGFGEPEMMAVSERFQKPGRPKERAVFEAHFGVYDKKGAIQNLNYLLPVPNDGAANRKSNLFKMLRSLGAGDGKLWNGDGFAEGVSLESFLGKEGVLNVKMNEKEFAQVDAVAPRMDGVKYPTLEECKALESSEDVPF
jgi:hypothetical protein